MIFKIRLFSCVLLLLFVSFFKANGQHRASEVDSTFESYMNKAWQEIRNSSVPERDSLQSIYSYEFYNYYLQNQKTDTGEKALEFAFVMWSNINYSKYVQEALESINYDTNIWSRIIGPLGRLYVRNEDLGGFESYNELLVQLKAQLTDPVSKSEVILRLLRFKERNDTDRAIELARLLVEIDATDFYVDQGLGYLHEFEFLNIGQKAPDFKAQTIDGSEISISGLKGKFVLLEFWATWCGPCLPEIPHLIVEGHEYSPPKSISIPHLFSELSDSI